MKKLLELIICIFHPLAVVLMWIDLPKRHDLPPIGKAVWAIFGIIPLMPFIYIMSGGDFW